MDGRRYESESRRVSFQSLRSPVSYRPPTLRSLLRSRSAAPRACDRWRRLCDSEETWRNK